MQLVKKTYDYKQRFGDDYHKIIAFLTELTETSNHFYDTHFGRFAWMISRPLDDESIKSSFAYWTLDEKVIGLSFFELDPKYQFLVAHEKHAFVYDEMFKHLLSNTHQLDELFLSIPDSQNHLISIASQHGFTETKTKETILSYELSKETQIPDDLELQVVDMTKDWDIRKYNTVMWKGFDHEGEPDQTEADLLWRQTMLSSPDLDHALVIALQNNAGDYVSHTGIWYKKDTDIAYVEPLVTIPEYRGKGIGKLCLEHAMGRAFIKGAKKAIVLSDQTFYKKIGFKHLSTSTWWKKVF